MVFNNSGRPRKDINLKVKRIESVGRESPWLAAGGEGIKKNRVQDNQEDITKIQQEWLPLDLGEGRSERSGIF
jgi:hypothetical protein